MLSEKKHHKASIILNQIVRIIGFNPASIFYYFKGLPYFVKDFIIYKKISSKEQRFPLKVKNLFPQYKDRFLDAGKAKGHYFFQDLWAAKKIFQRNPQKHIDIGSRIDGFISHLLVFREVTVIDVRSLKSSVSGMEYQQNNITNLQYPDNSIESISCLHAIEHIGLGRYGDIIDVNGWFKALCELQRVLSKGGRLYVSVPIGEECLYFNAHRVFSPKTIVDALSELTLVSFAYVNDNGEFIDSNIAPNEVALLKYGCGLFEFKK